MSTARIVISLLGFVGGAWYGATKLRIGGETDRGTIEHVITDKDKDGNFINNNTMYFQHVSEPGSASLIDAAMDMENPQAMDLHGDSELIKKAKKYCKEGTITEVTFDWFLAANPISGKPSRRVIAIEAIGEEEPQQKFKV